MLRKNLIKLFLVSMPFLFSVSLKADPIDDLIKVLTELKDEMGGFQNISSTLDSMQDLVKDRTDPMYIAQISAIFAGTLSAGLVIYAGVSVPIKKLMKKISSNCCRSKKKVSRLVDGVTLSPLAYQPAL